MIFFSSDHHFGHKNILKYCPNRRRFPDPTGEGSAGGSKMLGSIYSHDKWLMKQWNEVVRPSDTVYYVGDFAFLPPKKAIDIAKSLNGQKHMIWGNHDKGLRKDKDFIACFESCQDYLKIKVPDEEMDEEQTIVLFHYPIMSWDRMYHGSWMLHGHCHGCLPEDNNPRIDIGIDKRGGKPISYDEVKVLMTLKALHPLEVPPKHG